MGAGSGQYFDYYIVHTAATSEVNSWTSSLYGLMREY